MGLSLEIAATPKHENDYDGKGQSDEPAKEAVLDFARAFGGRSLHSYLHLFWISGQVDC
jgi:hypothetical protein